MNYRHHYHAGNYADVFKHALLVPLVRAMQRKDKGFLYLDTHAGRGGYDLAAGAYLADGRERAPEWPAGIGRFWAGEGGPLQAYLDLVREFDRERGGGAGGQPGHYPGSPWLAQRLLRPQDRAALCELRAEEAEALDLLVGAARNVKVHAMDGYTALRALLPPPEKRALVLIDPPFESQTEFADIGRGLGEALRRFPSGVYAVWYPVTERARVDRFMEGLAALRPPPTLTVELQIAGDSSQIRMKGCGLLVINPPWRIEPELRAGLPLLGERLAQDAGAGTRLTWLVPEA